MHDTNLNMQKQKNLTALIALSEFNGKRLIKRFFINMIWVGLPLTFAGCSGYKVQPGTPEVLGERTNSNGEVIQQVVRIINTSTKQVLLTPEGPRPSIKYKIEYFLKETNKPDVELSFVSDKEFHFSGEGKSSFQNCDRFWAVAGSPLWIGTGIDPTSREAGGHPWIYNGQQLTSQNGKDLHIVVFDNSHVLAHRPVTVIPKFESLTDEFTMGNNNMTITINSTVGLKRYDVIHDAFTDFKLNPAEK